MSQISIAQIKIFLYLEKSDWVTTEEIAKACSVTLVTVQRYTKYLIELGLVDKVVSHPTRYFRFSQEARKNASGEVLVHIQNVDRVKDVLESVQAISK